MNDEELLKLTVTCRLLKVKKGQTPYSVSLNEANEFNISTNEYMEKFGGDYSMVHRWLTVKLKVIPLPTPPKFYKDRVQFALVPPKKEGTVYKTYKFKKIKEHTPKAIYIDFYSYGLKWVPLSVCGVLDEISRTIEIATWFMEKKDTLDDNDDIHYTKASPEDINDFFGYPQGSRVMGINYGKNRYGCDPDELGEDYFRED